MIGERSGRPPNAVLRVELGGQSPPGGSVVESLLDQPGRKFPVSVEAEAGAYMPDEVMDSTKSVVTAAEVAVQQWVTPVPFPGTRADLQNAMSADCADQLVVGMVGALTESELDSETAMEWMI